MDDPLQRPLAAEARAQSVIDAASQERQRMIDAALATAHESEAVDAALSVLLDPTG